MIRIPLKNEDGVSHWLEIELLLDYNVYFALVKNEGGTVSEHMAMPEDVVNDFMNKLQLRGWDQEFHLQRIKLADMKAAMLKALQ